MKTKTNTKPLNYIVFFIPIYILSWGLISSKISIEEALLWGGASLTMAAWIFAKMTIPNSKQRLTELVENLDIDDFEFTTGTYKKRVNAADIAASKIKTLDGNHTWQISIPSVVKEPFDVSDEAYQEYLECVTDSNGFEVEMYTLRVRFKRETLARIRRIISDTFCDIFYTRNPIEREKLERVYDVALAATESDLGEQQQERCNVLNLITSVEPYNSSDFKVAVDTIKTRLLAELAENK